MGGGLENRRFLTGHSAQEGPTKVGPSLAVRCRRWRCRRARSDDGEAAYSLTLLGLGSCVLDRNPHPRSRQLDAAAGALVRQLMRDLGIEILPATSATRLLAGVDLLSAGVTSARSDRDEETRGGKVIGHPQLIDRVATAVAERTPVAPIIDSLRAGDWTVLAE
jgi:hypothetical protein